ncbi:MAG: hypothetical protein KC729_13670 [Candidatus Eisenbacteria bacterium]|uniref:FlgD/Vpr Ig-like domain-containing protein n=1 Tax=Eiseniibacteriota bacterium TaxID=2212470 RepID=A0A956M0U9_UNCEI|nr:hypothetical protein [Candidatus Eisenbacteria bacterium]
MQYRDSRGATQVPEDIVERDRGATNPRRLCLLIFTVVFLGSIHASFARATVLLETSGAPVPVTDLAAAMDDLRAHPPGSAPFYTGTVTLPDPVYENGGNSDLDLTGLGFTLRVQSAGNDPTDCRLNLGGNAFGHAAGPTDIVLSGIELHDGVHLVTGLTYEMLLEDCILRNIQDVESSMVLERCHLDGVELAGGNIFASESTIENGGGSFGEATDAGFYLTDCVVRNITAPFLFHAYDFGFNTTSVILQRTVIQGCDVDALIRSEGANVRLEDVAIVGNDGIVLDYASNGLPTHLVVTHCTIADNRGTGPLIQAAEDEFGDLLDFRIERSIVAFNDATVPVDYSGVTPLVVQCSDVFGNSGGDYVGSLAGYEGIDGNISTDPLFCHFDAGDVYLSEGSPADADCGVMGAYPIGCEISGAPESVAQSMSPLQVWPSPASGAVWLSWDVPSPASVRVTIFDLSGRTVRHFGGVGEPAMRFLWDGRDDAGRLLPAGRYWIRATDGTRQSGAGVTRIR